MAAMEEPMRSSIHVAPLQIFKAGADSLSRCSSRPQTSASNQHGFGINGRITPPLTPDDVNSTCGLQDEFQSYLRAFYPYYPTEEEDSSTVTLPLNQGDIILIHSIHTNGWADGTLLSSGARGWLPTNYCEGYCNEQISDLLKALSTFWDLVKTASEGRMDILRNSNYIRGLIVGVRCCLDRTQCLSRDCPLIKANAAIRKQRRALLSDLSAFVKVTKALESWTRATSDSSQWQVDLDEMVLKAFKLVTRAVKFLDAWEDHMYNPGLSQTSSEVPPTPPSERSEFGDVARRDSSTRQMALATTSSARDTEIPPATQSSHNRTSLASIRPMSRSSCTPSLRPLSQQGSGQVTHRVSYVAQTRSQNLASEQLGNLHNAFLTYLGYFIGLHIQSRSSSELLLTTKESVLACRDLLDLVTEVWDRDRRKSKYLGNARDEMYRKIAELAEAARDIFRPLRAEEDEILVPAEGKGLMDAATACVRAAGECVAECRFIIERIGDFELPSNAGTPALEIPNSIATNEPLHAVQEEQQFHFADDPSISSTSASNPPQSPSSTLAESTATGASVLSTLVSPTEPASASTVPSKDSFSSTGSETLLPPLPPFAPNIFPQDEDCPSPGVSFGSTGDSSIFPNLRMRKDSVDVSSAGDSSACVGSMRDSETSAVSQSSTRATSPDAYLSHTHRNQSFTNGQPAEHRLCETTADDIESDLLDNTYEHELVFSKDGQITGGTLRALIERLTIPNCTPDATFVSTFYLTFRLFATPMEFAQALVDRYNYVGDSPRISGPVRLRVYNAFKNWLESHWRHECDKPALELISTFATRQLQIVLPTAGKRLASLTEQVTTVTGPLVPRLISSIGKTNTAIAQYIPPDTPLPSAIMSKSQMNGLKNWKLGNASLTVMDFDPTEFARQLTIKESQIFCSILPEELLANEWTKQSGSLAVNVRAMSRLSTDLTNLVADNILQAEDPKKRAAVIKQWTKIAEKLHDLSNFHSFMAIICSLAQSTIQRLKRTWEHVSNKTKLRFEKFKVFLNPERNSAVLRQTFQNQVPPCIPFVGMYLTDLTFTDAGNPTTRQMPSSRNESPRSVINFDKHMKTAKIISELQRFQIPYRLQEIPELQTWIQDQLVRVRTTDQTAVVKDYYRRSLLLEPREARELQNPSGRERQKLELFFLGSKDKSMISAPIQKVS